MIGREILLEICLICTLIVIYIDPFYVFFEILFSEHLPEKQEEFRIGEAIVCNDDDVLALPCEFFEILELLDELLFCDCNFRGRDDIAIVMDIIFL